MKSIYKKGALFAAAALMAFGLSGCGGDSGNASKGPKDTLTVGVTNFADSLEPTDNYFGWQVMRYGIGECLVTPRSRSLPSRACLAIRSSSSLMSLPTAK